MGFGVTSVRFSRDAKEKITLKGELLQMLPL